MRHMRRAFGIVAASGDWLGGTRLNRVVYPARYQGPIAACGAMADGSPYYNLPGKRDRGTLGTRWRADGGVSQPGREQARGPSWVARTP